MPILDFGETEDTLYLAMRFVDGGDLRRLLADDGPLEPERAIALLAQVADALDEAHRRGLVHRDVKPANILLETGDDGEHAYLGDFGLAKHATSPSSVTREQAFVGTIAYVSPEQIRGGGACVQRGARDARQRHHGTRRRALRHPRPPGRRSARAAGDAALLRRPGGGARARRGEGAAAVGRSVLRAHADRGRDVLDRNPNYTGSRPRRPARIVYLTGVPTSRAVTLADAGRVDVVTWDYDLHGPLAPSGALAAVWDEQPTDRYVPPAVSMPPAPQVYALTPDLARARAAGADRLPRTASLYFCGEPANLRIARIVRANLRPLGIHVSITQSLDCLRGDDPKARRADILLATRATALLDPAPFLEALTGDTSKFGSGFGPATWDDTAFRARLRAARTLAGGERLAAYRRLEDEVLRDQAPFAAFGAFVLPEYLSARTGCRVVQGAYGVVDLGALCVRKPG